MITLAEAVQHGSGAFDVIAIAIVLYCIFGSTGNKPKGKGKDK